MITLFRLSISIIIFSLFFVGVTDSVYSQKLYSGNNASEFVPGSKQVRMRSFNNIPAYISFKKGNELSVENFESWFHKTFEVKKDCSFENINTYEDRLGMYHYKYRQTFKGIPVEGAVMNLHTKNDNIYSINGFVFSDFSINVNAKLTEDKARQKAIEFIGADTYKWELRSEEKRLKQETGNSDTSYYPQGKLLIAPNNGVLGKGKFKLVYKFDVYAHAPLSRNYVYVNAHNGDIIFTEERIHHGNDTGTAETKYSGTQTIIADSIGTNSFILRDFTRGDSIKTYNMEEGTNYGNAVNFFDDDNYWDNYNADEDEVATDAHWGAEMTYDYFYNKFGRNSIDDAGFNLLSYVHYDVDYNNAFWDGQRMTYGDGSGSTTPLTAIDIAGHEITHGLTSMTADLIYQDESGALSESFSDIFGTSIEFYAVPSKADWYIGEDIGSPMRSMSDPNNFDDPDTYQGNYWHTGPGDNGGVHTNSGVQNFWFYILSTGKSGTNDFGDNYNISGIGIDKAAAVAYRNLVVYLISYSDYQDARFYAIKAAEDLYGRCSDEFVQTTNAWHAVGIGEKFDTSAISDFTVSDSASCTAPYKVDLTSTIPSASSYKWYFGDGDSSSAANPTHTYSNYGKYTVKLIVDGGCRGVDTTVKTDYINIDSTLSCVFKMPKNDTLVVNSCTGTLYDDGGPLKNYSDSTDSWFTIQLPNASYITLDFKSFAFEEGSSSGVCDYDHIEIFDGADGSAPLIGKYCGDTTLGSFTSSGNAITIHQFSDPYVQEAGYKVEWWCKDTTLPPVADFTVSDTLTCNGKVTYKDLSINSPKEWFWDFGDGDTSNKQNPSHTYLNNGTYSVKLVVSDSNGSDSLTKTEYIHVNKPQKPSTNDSSRCGDGSVTLSASGNGVLEWYTDSVNGTKVNTGNSYSTPVLSTSTDYYVQDKLSYSPQYVGPKDTTIGSGGFHYNTSFYLYFDCMSQFTLKSVKVYADGAGDRTIELRDSTGNVLQDTTVSLPDGESRIKLNFNVNPGDNYALATSGTSNMYRNDGGVNFPYEIPGVVSITGNNIPDPNYYYYYYDWKIQRPTCISEREKVTAVIDSATYDTIEVDTCDDYTVPSGDETYVNSGSYDDTLTNSMSCDSIITINLTLDSLDTAITKYTTVSGTVKLLADDSTASSYQWVDCNNNFDTIENETDSVFIPSNDGSYAVILTKSACRDTSNCEDVIISGVIENEFKQNISVYPNPNSGNFTIETGKKLNKESELKITDISGKEIRFQKLDPKKKIKIELNEPAGIYFLTLISGDRKAIIKVIKR
ncbi:MAG: M4 family metallopeptidase [Flavobacteriales bacterium]